MYFVQTKKNFLFPYNIAVTARGHNLNFLPKLFLEFQKILKKKLIKKNSSLAHVLKQWLASSQKFLKNFVKKIWTKKKKWNIPLFVPRA
jgi:hypothetical protein